MVQKFLKFIETSPYKERLLSILEDIYHDRLEEYDIKPLKGLKNHYRIRVGSVRIIFEKSPGGAIIKEIGNRGDIY